MDEDFQNNTPYSPGEKDCLFPLEINYHTGLNLDPEVASPLIETAWSQVKDELVDFILLPEFKANIEISFDEKVNVDLVKDNIKDILTGENLPGIQVLSAADMNPAVGAYDPLTGEIYLADSLLGGTAQAKEQVLSDLSGVLLEELGHHLDPQLPESDSPGDEGELFRRLVRGETLDESEVLRLRAEDDFREIRVWGVLVEVEATQKIDFEEFGPFEVDERPNWVAVGEFNGDEFLDLAVANENSDNVSVLLGKAYSSFGPATNFDVGDRPWSVGVGEFNGDDFSDLVVTSGPSGQVSILLGKGDGGFGPATNFDVGDSPRSVVVEDLNGDGFSDLVVVNPWSDKVSVLLGEGKGSFGLATDFNVGDEPESLVVGDFDRDNIPDLAVANKFSDNVSILLGRGNGSFGRANNFDGGDGPSSLAVGEFNGDSFLDLAVGNYFSDNISVLLGVGDGSFGSATNFRAGDEPTSIAAGEFNGDGFSDLVVANENSDDISILLGNGNGGFGPPTNFDVGDEPESVAIGDFNGNGIADLAVANEFSGNVSILINQTSITTVPNITISDTKIKEGNRNKTAEFTVILDNPSNEIVKVNYTTANQTAKVNQDYRLAKGTLIFQPGETQQTITVPILGDRRDEAQEKFKLNLSSPQNANLKDAQAMGTILDNDPLPKISIGDAKVTEGNRGQKNMTFEVRLNNPSGKTVGVNYGTVEGSAKSGEDYQEKRGVVKFKPGQKKKIINIPIFGDTEDEQNEQFQVILSRARNAKFSDKKAVGMIRDNDEAVPKDEIMPQISIGDAKVTEGNRGQKRMEFEVELDSASQKMVKVNYSTVDGSAKSGEDYRKKSGVVTFKPGQTKKIVNIPILGDTQDEDNEKFQVQLSGAKNAKFSDRKGVGIIEDNDRPVPEVFEDAIDLGVLSREPISVVDKIGFTVGPVNRNTEDYFRFEVEKEGSVSIFVDSFVQDLGIKLYDEEESLLNQSNKGGDLKEIETILESGVYYLKVVPVGGSRTKYNLSVNIVEF